MYTMLKKKVRNETFIQLRSNRPVKFDCPEGGPPKIWPGLVRRSRDPYRGLGKKADNEFADQRPESLSISYMTF